VQEVSPRVALATCAEIPGGDEDFPALIAALAEAGVDAAPAVWDAEIDWASFDLVVLRSAWDYAERRDEFVRWTRSLEHVLNPAAVVEWNTDKRYLTELEAAGVPIIPTAFVAPGETFAVPPEPFVVKPAISAGGRSSAWFEPAGAEAARSLLARIHAEGRTAMVQPYLGDAEETALVYIDGTYSHALRRRVPLPSAGERPVFYLDEELGRATESAAQRSAADAALACVPGDVLYARVDLLGEAVLELEVAEPSLYLAFGSGAAARLAGAIARRLGRRKLCDQGTWGTLAG
jgi:glutathione synthase/RimK-type ligase-like ATP-grasp enzyme